MYTLVVGVYILVFIYKHIHVFIRISFHFVYSDDHFTLPFYLLCVKYKNASRERLEKCTPNNNGE